MIDFCIGIMLFALSSVSAVECTVVGVVDGDTVVLRNESIVFTMDLAYVDAPELGPSPVSPCQPLAKEAKRYLEQVLIGNKVRVIVRGRTAAGRPAAELFLSGTNVNLQLVKAGLGEVYVGALPRDSSLEPYFRNQQEARSAQRGIWGLGKARICPRKWRERCKERSAFAAFLYILVSQPRR